MALGLAHTIALFGLGGTAIEVEADISSNLPSFVLVGLPDASLSESTSRVRAACANSGLSLPARRVTVNLSPAAVPKHGSSFDLAIALAVLAAAGQVNATSVARFAHFGELGLDGSLRPVAGVLPMLLAAKRAGFSRAVVPAANEFEAKLVEDIEIFAASHLTQVAAMHGSPVDVRDYEASQKQTSPIAAVPALCMSEIIGQQDAVDAMVVAAAGRHHVLMVGPPGAGKTMLAERLPTILPELSVEQSLEVAAVRSLTATTSITELAIKPPFESPHHSSSMVALIGGGVGIPKPGLASKANQGVLFLDEAPEFSSQALEALRQPLESGQIIVSRAAGNAWYPARFQLVMAANPCPCGNWLSKPSKCTCSAMQRSRYLAKLSGPLLDRIDVQLTLGAATPASLALGEQVERKTSSELRQIVVEARRRASLRLSDTPWRANGEITGAYLRKHLRPEKSATAAIDAALSRGLISMRGYDRCLRVAWTCADLAQRDKVTKEDVLQALALRGQNLLGAVA